MSRAIRRIVAYPLLAAPLLAGLLIPLLPRGAVVPEGGADGFNGAEIALAQPDDGCVDWGATWGMRWGTAGPIPGVGPGWGSMSGGAEGGIEALVPVAVHDDMTTDEGGEDGFFPHAVAALPALPPCGAAGGWPVAEVPAWTPFGTPFGGTALDGSDVGSDSSGTDNRATGGAGWVGALPSHGFWPAWPGIAGTAAGGATDRNLASPADDDGGGTVPVDDETLVLVEPPPGQGSAAVMPEPGMLLLLGIAMVVLGLLRRDWA